MSKKRTEKPVIRSRPMSEEEMDALLAGRELIPEKPPEEKADSGEPALPEDFRPVIPEPEIRRRSAYYFRRDYPEIESPTSTHTVTFAQMERRRKWRARVLYALLLLTVFTLAFVITAACLMISKQPIG